MCDHLALPLCVLESQLVRRPPCRRFLSLWCAAEEWALPRGRGLVVGECWGVLVALVVPVFRVTASLNSRNSAKDINHNGERTAQREVRATRPMTPTPDRSAPKRSGGSKSSACSLKSPPAHGSQLPGRWLHVSVGLAQPRARWPGRDTQSVLSWCRKAGACDVLREFRHCQE